MLFRYIINTYVNNIYKIVTYDLIEEFDFLFRKILSLSFALFIITSKKMCHLKDMFLFFSVMCWILIYEWTYDIFLMSLSALIIECQIVLIFILDTQKEV